MGGYFSAGQCAMPPNRDFTNYYTTLGVDKDFIGSADAAVLNRNLGRAIQLLSDRAIDVVSLQTALEAYNLKQWDQAATALFIETNNTYQSSPNKKKYIYKEIEESIVKKIENLISKAYQQLCLRWDPDRIGRNDEHKRLLANDTRGKLSTASILRNYDFRHRYSERLKNLDNWGGHDQVVEDSKAYQERREQIKKQLDQQADLLNQQELKISNLFDLKDLSNKTYEDFVASVIQGIKLLPQYCESGAQLDLTDEIENFFLRTIGVIKVGSNFDFAAVNEKENIKFFIVLYKIENISDNAQFSNWLKTGKKPEDLKEIVQELHKLFLAYKPESELSKKLKDLRDAFMQLQGKLKQLSQKLGELKQKVGIV